MSIHNNVNTIFWGQLAPRKAFIPSRDLNFECIIFTLLLLKYSEQGAMANLKEINAKQQ